MFVLDLEMSRCSKLRSIVTVSHSLVSRVGDQCMVDLGVFIRVPKEKPDIYIYIYIDIYVSIYIDIYIDI